MKSTSRSQEASPHLSWGSQIAQVTSRRNSTHMIHTPTVPKPHCSYPPPGPCSYMQFVLYLFAEAGVTAAWIWAAILLPLALHLHTGKWDEIPFLVPHRRRKKEEEGKKKKKKNIQEMKVVTRSSVCQTSPWAGTKGPEKSCWDYFSLQMTEEEGGCLRETWMDKDRKTDNGIFRLARN